MGTRLCSSDATSSRLTAVSEPSSTRLGPADLTLDDGCLAQPSRLGVTGCLSPVDVGVADRRAGGVHRGTQTDSDVEARRVCADVMYTNRANLRHTIAVQQRIFREQLADRQANVPAPAAADRPRPTTVDGSTSPTRPAAKLEWIVRKRSDGSRYVTRRAVRSVRPTTTTTWVGDATTTTDDDVEQPKTGRYWTRDERRQHVAERRQRQAMKRAGSRCPSGRPQHALAAELAAVSRHHQAPLLSVATV